MFSFSFVGSVKHSLGFTLALWAIASTAHTACMLPDGPPETLVPDGYHYSEKGEWKYCKKGSWSVKGPVTDDRPYTTNKTGVCLPLENQFTKKNGVISMNFVPEKSRRNFYGFEHECVASTWWRVPGGATVSDLSEVSPPKPPPAKKKKPDPLAGLDDFYNSDSEKKTDPGKIQVPPTPPAKPESPSFSAGIAPETPKPTDNPVLEKKDDIAPRVDPAPALSSPVDQKRIEEDYRTCQINCRKGKDQRLRDAGNRCKKELREKYGDGQWSAKADKEFNRCRILAARQENRGLRACLLPCKKQAGKNVWMGP